MNWTFRHLWTAHRRLVIPGLALGVFVAVLGLVHTPFVRGRVLGLVVERLRTDAGIDARIDRLDYNLLTLRVSLGATTLSALDADAPFLTIESVSVNLPWSIVTGRIALESVEIVRPTFSVTSNADGRLNLPAATSGESAEPEPSASASIGPIDIGQLVIRELGIGYTDRPAELSVDGRGITLEMSRDDGPPLAGRLSMSGGIGLTAGGRQTRVSRLEGGLGFDGSALAFDQFTIEAPEARLQLDGRVDLLDEAPSVDARYEGRLILDQIGPWVAPDEQLSGAIDFSGAATGALDAPTVTLAVSAENLAWRDQRGIALAARGGMSGSTATLDQLRLSLGGGTIEGRARVGLAGQEASHAELAWTRLDLGALARSAGVTEPRIATVAAGRATADWTGGDLQGASATIDTTLATGRAAGGALAMGGRLSAALARGNWNVTIDGLATRAARVDLRASGRLNGDDLAAATLGGRLAGVVESLPALVNELRAAGIAVPADSPLDAGAASFDVTLTGTLGAPVATGTLAATGLDAQGLGPGTLDAAFVAGTSRVEVGRLGLVLGPNSVSGNLVADLDAGTLRGTFAADLPRLEPLTAMLPPESRPEGAATLQAEVGGTFDNPLVQVEATAIDIAVAGQRIARVGLTARLKDQLLSVDRFDLNQEAGRLGLTGTYALGSGRYTVKGEGRGLVVRPIATADEPLPVDATFDLDISGEGTIANPQGRGTISVRDLAWGNYAIGALRAEANLAGGNLRLTASVPSLQATLDAVAALNAPRRFMAELAVRSADLDALARSSGPGRERAADLPSETVPLTGSIAALAKATGDLDRPADAVVDIDLRLVDVTAAGAPIRLNRPARLRYEAGRIIADDFEVQSGNTTLIAAGAFGDPASPDGLTVRLDGGLADFLPFTRLAPALEGLDAAGAINLTLHAAGTLEAPRVDATMSLSGASASMPDLPPVTNLRVQAALDQGLLTLTDLGAAWQGATVRATGTVPLTILGDQLPAALAGTLPSGLPDRARAEIHLDSVTAAMAEPFVDQATLDQLEATVAATVVVEATSLELDDITAHVSFDRAEFLVAGEPLKQDRPTTLKLAGGRVTVGDWSWSGAGNTLRVTGDADIAGEIPAVKGALAGSLDLRMLGAVSPDLAAGGRADFDIRATGPLADPDLEGEVTLHEGELAIRDPRIAITDLRGTVALFSDRISLVDVQASANGGSLQMSGDMTLDAFQPVSGSVRLQGRGLALEIPENLRSEVDLDLTFHVSAEAPELTGTVTVLRGSYRSPISLTGQLLSGVQVEPAVPTEPSLLDRIRLAINVVSAEGIIVDNNYGKLEIETDLKVAGTPAQPALAGRLTISEGGAVFLGGQTWALERGTVDFTSATRIEPNLNLSLVTRVQRYDVRLSVTGTPETLEATLSSPDGISQADAVSLLLTGQLADEQSMAQTEIARGQLLLLLSGELLGFAGRAVGLDSAQVGRGLGGAASSFDLLATDTDPSARLTITKQLRRDVELVFSQSLRDSNDLTWIAIYRPIKAIELRTTTLDNNARTYEFRNELNFGGGARRATAARVPQPRVSTVTWAGTPGFDERELRGRVKIEEGDRFDFYRWQQDRDRLTDFYHDRGYLEARIRATRETVESATAEPSIAITYTIERGPATSLLVEGAALPGGVVADMRDAWARAMFDGFLRDDLEGLAKQALAEDGYLQAAAVAEIREDASADSKQIVVRLTPGTRQTDRRLVFEGQQTQSADELRKVVEDRRLALTAWVRPSEVEDALAAHYRSLGFQRAEVSIGSPVFTSGRAALPVEIAEGPQFQIASVDITGVTARPLDEVRKAFGVEPGTPYIPSALEPARREVEVGYLQQGYNDVRVSVKSVGDPEAPTAHITLDVTEGPRQVLAAVSVTGADITTTGTVETALDLKTGEPADLTSTYRAQKRLYDTGVFQRADVELQPMGEPGADGTQPVRAAVTLAEVPPYRLRYGVRLTDDTGPIDANREFRPGFVVDFLRRNLFGRALSAGVAGQIEADRRLARGILSAPQLFGLPVTSNLFLTRSRQDFTAPGITPFVQDGSEITAEQRFRPRPNMAVSYDYRYLRTRAFQLDPPAGEDPFELKVNIARLTSTFAWDTRDDPFNARRGWFHSSGFEYGVPSLGSDLRFLKFVAQQFYFKPIGDEVVLASAFRLGTAWGYEEPLLFSERYFVGGGTSVRGFAENGVGGVDFLDDPVGGAGSLILNQEVRFPIYKWVRGIGFLDAGNVYRRTRDLSLADLEYGAGFGLRIDTPFGLARIDYGMPLTDRSRQPFGRWYFSLGQAF